MIQRRSKSTSLGVGSVSVGLLIGACASPPATQPIKPSIASSSTSTETKQTLPPGVLAEVKGIQGVIRVEERDGWRRLTIDGVTQGASSLRAGAPLANENVPRDPLVELIIGARPKAKTVLLLGLGTGKTAMDLMAAGLTVKSVEIEPAVVDLARRFFGFKGEAIVGDGVAILKASNGKGDEKYDVVIFDAMSRTDALPPPPLPEPDLRRVVGEKGMVTYRFVATPDKARSFAKASAKYSATFGSGVGQESQNGGAEE